MSDPGSKLARRCSSPPRYVMKTSRSRPLRLFLLTLLLCFGSKAVAAPPTVLLFAIDGLNDWVGCLGGHPQARTPNIDRLSKRGVIFANAHCAAPLCNPSRAAVFS